MTSTFDLETITKKKVEAEETELRRSTKIVATMGRWTSATDGSAEELLLKLIDAGMSVMRLNFSHGDHASHRQCITNLKAALRQRPEKHVAVMLDTKGPEIRTGKLKDEFNPLRLVQGQQLELTTDYSYLGDNECVACSYPSLCSSVVPGQTILCADSSLILTVLEVNAESGRVVTRVECNASIGEKKNMCLPGVAIDLPVVTEKDKRDLLEFGLANPIHCIALSFTQRAEDIAHVRELMGPRGRHIKIIAKIENQEGLRNFDGILGAADGIMVARGDLGMGLGLHQVFLAQKSMIQKCNIAGKPVITATQMLESMITNPRPTRAEASDVANAILDGTDCVMLSGESANGAFPVEAVSIMARICGEAERCINRDSLYQLLRSRTVQKIGNMSTSEAIASSAVKTAMDVGAKMIVVLTESGNTARLIAKYRPSQAILAMCANHGVATVAGGLYSGVTPFTINSMVGTEQILLRACQIGKEMGFVSGGDSVVAIHGTLEQISGATNLLRVLIVPK